MATFNLNTDNARKADMPARITETGPYVGTLTRAELVQAQSGAEGVEFTFVADDGRRADYLTLWMTNGDGKELRGRRVFDAMLTCMGLRTVSSKRGTIKAWDFDKGAEAEREAELLPELMSKKIGLVLQREEYFPSSGGAKKDRMQLFTVFRAQDRMMAKEILDRAVRAEALDKMLPTVKDRTAQQRTSSGSGEHMAGASGGGFGSGPAFDDDIPF